MRLPKLSYTQVVFSVVCVSAEKRGAKEGSESLRLASSAYRGRSATGHLRPFRSEARMPAFHPLRTFVSRMSLATCGRKQPVKVFAPSLLKPTVRFVRANAPSS